MTIFKTCEWHILWPKSEICETDYNCKVYYFNKYKLRIVFPFLVFFLLSLIGFIYLNFIAALSCFFNLIGLFLSIYYTRLNEWFKCKKFFRQKRIEKKQLEKAQKEMIKFIESMGGHDFIESCEQDQIYTLVELKNQDINPTPDIYFSSKRGMFKPSKL